MLIKNSIRVCLHPSTLLCRLEPLEEIPDALRTTFHTNHRYFPSTHRIRHAEQYGRMDCADTCARVLSSVRYACLLH